MKVFDVQTGAVLIDQRTEPSRSLVRYTADNKYLIEAVGKKVEIWDADHHSLLQVIKAAPSCMAISRDGHYLALAGGDASWIDQSIWLSLIFHPNGGGGRVIVYKLR